MKKALFLALSVALFSSSAFADRSQFLERIPTLVKYLLSKDGEKVLGPYGQALENGDQLTSFAYSEHSIGKAEGGLGIGEMKFFRLVATGKNGEGEILLDRFASRQTGDSSYLYLYADLRNAQVFRDTSVTIKAAVQATLNKLTRRIEAAAKEMKENHPFPDLQVFEENAWEAFKYDGNGFDQRWMTSGKVYQLRIDQMDPAVLQEFLENIVNRVESMPAL